MNLWYRCKFSSNYRNERLHTSVSHNLYECLVVLLTKIVHNFHVLIKILNNTLCWINCSSFWHILFYHYEPIQVLSMDPLHKTWQSSVGTVGKDKQQLLHSSLIHPPQQWNCPHCPLLSHCSLSPNVLESHASDATGKTANNSSEYVTITTCCGDDACPKQTQKLQPRHTHPRCTLPHPTSCCWSEEGV